MRNAVREEIATITPWDLHEQRDLASALEWIDSGVALCRTAKPATPPMHLVSYFAVVDLDNILLVDHKNARLWLPTGGHVEPGEHPRETVVRELREELGLLPSEAIDSPIMLTCTSTVGFTAGHTDVSLWYVVRVNRDQTIRFDEEEFNAIRWFGFNEIPFERSDPHMKRFIEKLGSTSSFQRTDFDRR